MDVNLGVGVALLAHLEARIENGADPIDAQVRTAFVEGPPAAVRNPHVGPIEKKEGSVWNLSFNRRAAR